MNVRLAAQLFSTSISDALTFCNSVMALTIFVNVAPTADFLKLINDLFDIFDCKTWGIGFKQALNIKNYKADFMRLDEVKKVIFNLETDADNHQNVTKRVNILKSPRYTGRISCLHRKRKTFI